MRYVLLPILLLAACRAQAPAGEDARGSDAAGELPTIAAATAGLRALPGFVSLWLDEDGGRVFAVLPGEGVTFLYGVSLPGGLGSNDVGLDRGQLGPRRVVEARRVGRRVLLVAPNLEWRSGSSDPSVRRAARESFAESVLFGFDAVAEDDGDRVLVELTDFLQQDAHGIARRLRGSGQGDFSLDRSRGALLPGSAAAFPRNSAIEVLSTFTASDPGRDVVATAPDPRSVTLRVRHAFAALPDEPMTPRAFHPRSGFFPHSWRDLSAPVDEPLERLVLTRHRLEKVHPERASSPVVRPIVYYVDRGAPEPVRTALVEGARYWEPVFEAAGFEGGFRVELLPEDADPHDLSYNVVQWVNRSTRGWSYGETVTDPRTGEILKGHVTLGALRVRQDVLLAEGLLAPYGADDDDPRPVEMALARIRQLAAHEVGHTLGLAHNFAASARGRASVMDYPAPLVTLGVTGEPDVSDAYRDGCGEWDEVAIRYGYGSADEQVLADADARGLVYLTDRDARGADRAHPLANLWDNGADPVEHFTTVAAVRRAALERFSPAVLKRGRPLAELEEVLLPVYLHHRYQLEAVVRSLGGVRYGYDVRGERSVGVAPVPAVRQRRALELALSTLAPVFLELPASVRALVPPRAPGSGDGRERFVPGSLGLDPLAPAEASIELTLELLLDPARAARLDEQAALDASLPSFETLLAALEDRAWGTGATEFAGGLRPALLEELRLALVRRLALLEASDRASVRVRGAAHDTLRRIERTAGAESLLGGVIARFFEDPETLRALATPRVPPGSPIGCGEPPR